MPRPVKCNRCGDVSLTTARKGTIGCAKGKKRYRNKTVVLGCNGRKKPITQEEYDRWENESR